MNQLLSTKEVAQFLNVNEKMVYSLVADKGLPATKITGKWLFPRQLVERWVEANTMNYPAAVSQLPPYDGVLIIAGSNDLLLDETIALFNSLFPGNIAVFGNLGSTGGLRALRRNLCHMASSHLLHDNQREYNFDFAGKELNKMPAVVNFCRREQGLLLQKKNPRNIKSFADIARPGIRIVNRPIGTGTRLLFDYKLKEAGINAEKIEGYHNELSLHMDVGLQVLAGRADVGPGIRPVASLLGLEFIGVAWERYDLLIAKERFFDKGVQLFIGLFHEPAFIDLVKKFEGYDVNTSGKVIFPQKTAI